MSIFCQRERRADFFCVRCDGSSVDRAGKLWYNNILLGPRPPAAGPEIRERRRCMRVDILGVGFDNVTMDQAVAEGLRLMSAEGAHYVATPNPEIVEVCREDPEARAAVNGADLVIADGVGVIYGAKLLGTPLKERLPGIEFAKRLMAEMAKNGKKLYLLGAKPGVAEEAARRLRTQYPGLVIAGTHDGYFQEDGPVTEAIRGSGADVVFVCLGAPKQEKWMRKNGEATGAHLLVGLGGCLDVFSGAVQRAPEVFQRLGLEWLHRLAKNPSRIGRMMKLPLFLVHVGAERGKRK